MDTAAIAGKKIALIGVRAAMTGRKIVMIRDAVGASTIITEEKVAITTKCSTKKAMTVGSYSSSVIAEPVSVVILEGIA